MPADMKKYGPGWKGFSDHIRFDVAEGRCQCIGECGLHSLHPGPRRCIERHGEKARYANGMVVLTVAHLCKCDPPCQIEAHVKALCNRCHLRLDVSLHQKNRIRNRRILKEQLGQTTLGL